MELALLLVFVVIVELVVTVWLLANIKSYKRKVVRLERNVAKLANVVADVSKDAVLPVSPAEDSADSIAEMVDNATPEDLEQAQTLLAALGIRKD